MFHEGFHIGPYTLVRKLGRGGFGEVWLAERKAKFVTTKVAVKLPHDELVDQETIKQEASLWEQANGHPNILPIIDADEYDGQIVIVSEYAPDGSLEQWLKQNGTMSVERAIETTIQILDGLNFLHSRNIIHRDLKPANILLQGETPRVADFGISRALSTTVASQSQNISGTFAYMSPEALDGKRSVQTDVWSVGINLYQFLSGKLPFPQKEPSALIAAIIMRDYDPLPDHIPQSLHNVIACALAKQSTDRFTSALEMRGSLSRILRGNEPFESRENYPGLLKSTANDQNSPGYLNASTIRIADGGNEVETKVSRKTSFDQTIPKQKSNYGIYYIVGALFVILCAGVYWKMYLPLDSEAKIGANNKLNDTNSNNIANVPVLLPPTNSESTLDGQKQAESNISREDEKLASTKQGNLNTVGQTPGTFSGGDNYDPRFNGRASQRGAPPPTYETPNIRPAWDDPNTGSPFMPPEGVVLVPVPVNTNTSVKPTPVVRRGAPIPTRTPIQVGNTGPTREN